MHDFLNVIGVPPSATAVDVRRLTARYIRRAHPDFRPAQQPEPPAVPDRASRDAAVDFIDPVSFLDRIEQTFFTTPDPAA